MLSNRVPHQQKIDFSRSSLPAKSTVEVTLLNPNPVGVRALLYVGIDCPRAKRILYSCKTAEPKPCEFKEAGMIIEKA